MDDGGLPGVRSVPPPPTAFGGGRENGKARGEEAVLAASPFCCEVWLLTQPLVPLQHPIQLLLLPLHQPRRRTLRSGDAARTEALFAIAPDQLIWSASRGRCGLSRTPIV